MGESLRLGRVLGFPVAINWSVLVVVLLLAWGLAEGVLPESAPGHGATAYWLAGVLGAVLLIASLLAHELAHAVVASRSGVEVESLTLWVFGGVATLRGDSPTPRADFRIAAAGPATSIGLGAGFGAAWAIGALLGCPDLVLGVAAWLSAINVFLALFNLIPGAPLDGGRILRAALWARSGDREKAATAATSAGQALGYGLVVLGLLVFLAGDPVGGLWTIFIGWFVLAAARAEQSATVTRHLLEGVRVRDVMSPDVRTGSSELTVDEFVARHVLGGRHSAYPVLGHSGAVDGLVTLRQLRDVSPPLRSTTLVRDVALPRADFATCGPDEPVEDLLARLTRDSGGRALVFDRGRLVGIVTPADVARVLDARTLSRPPGRRTP
jgi:Zn-dependent protease/CBS domain-containing protein